MRTRLLLVLLAAGAFLCAFPSHAQDSQSLGDAARQARQQKQQKDSSPKATTTDTTTTKPKVITNDDLPAVGSTPSPTPAPQNQTQTSTPPASHSDYLNVVAERMKSQILAQKAANASLEAEIASLNDSIRYAGANCVANCVEWNTRQKEKQDRVVVMQQQLVVQQQHLADLQESARKQGFGSAITDP
jgi:hypothetical protein